MRLWRKQKRDGPAAGDLVPPEGVVLHFSIAGVGVRMAAQVIDILLTGIAAICILILLWMFELVRPQGAMAIGALLFFIIRIPYYVLTELAWNGQTLGKRMMKIKVVAHDGGPLTTHALVLRNLMKEAEVFLPGTLLLALDAATPLASLLALGWLLMALAIPVFNRYRQRLGDIMAGTHVIHLPQPVLLADLAAERPVNHAEAEPFVFLAHQLDHYGAFELQTLESLLRAQERTAGPEAYERQKAGNAAVVETIRRKIGYAETVPPAEHLRFLRAFYNAQRAHLEQRQLFGDRRADKFHSGAESGAEA